MGFVRVEGYDQFKGYIPRVGGEKAFRVISANNVDYLCLSIDGHYGMDGFDRELLLDPNAQIDYAYRIVQTIPNSNDAIATLIKNRRTLGKIEKIIRQDLQ